MPEQSEIKLHALDYWQVLRNRFPVIMLAFFLVFMTALVIAYLRPSEYLGRVQLQVQREANELEVFRETGAIADNANASPHMTFMQTQFEIIKSRNTLLLVINNLNLVEEFGVLNEQDAFAILQRKIDTENVRGTDLIDIEVYYTDAKLASDIANEVATSYRVRRVDEMAERASRALDTLTNQIEKQKGKLDKLRATMLDKMEQYRVVDLGLGTPSWLRGSQPNTGIGSLVMRAKEDEFTAEGSIQDLRTTIKAMQNLDGDELIKAAVDLGVNNQTLTKRYPDYQTALLTRESLRESGVGNKHPKSLNVDRQIELLKEMLVEAVDTAKSALGTRLEMAEQTLLNTKATKENIEQRSLRERRENLEYIDAKKDYELSKEVLNKMQENLDKESIDVGSTKSPIVIHENAVEQLLPARPNIQLHIILGAVVGLVFGVGMAFFLEYLDTSVKSLEDVERYLGVPVLAVIPNEVSILHKQSGLTPDAEAYRILRTNIEFNRRSADANSIAVVSGGAGEGKSTTLVNLAYVCAQGGYTTLMIDADLRRPQMHTFFDVNNSVGLTNFLTTDLVLEDVILQTPVENLYFMPSGVLPADAAGILNSRRMSELMADVKSRFDLVLVDSPPILGVSDASVLVSEADLTMVVIQHRKLPRAMLVRVKQAIENVGGDLFGVVLNNVDVRSDNQYQYYTSYYTYYSPTNIQEAPKENALDSDERDISGAELADSADYSEDEY
ncbi:MAG: polysaccharide biosynthesis tyrosine autokinase [Verrucomicrobiaceae bacterium]|nr:polysaccharide biosynthesis tyrosine autokinase [Verrucomicrobiaceae bacterium]